MIISTLFDCVIEIFISYIFYYIHISLLFAWNLLCELLCNLKIFHLGSELLYIQLLLESEYQI